MYFQKRPTSLAQTSIDNTSSKSFKEIRGILHENEKNLPSLVKSASKEVVKKKKKKLEESHINMASCPHAQDSRTLKKKPMMRQENKNPKDSLIYLK
jgi:hypothetical protein